MQSTGTIYTAKALPPTLRFCANGQQPWAGKIATSNLHSKEVCYIVLPSGFKSPGVALKLIG
jgi:hypothetical protein